MNENERTIRGRHVLITLAALVALAGCGDDDGTDTTDTMVMMDAGPTDGGPLPGEDAGSNEVPVTGWVFDTVTEMVVPDLEVCMYDHPEVGCDTTDAEGNFELSTEERGPVALTFIKEDYANILVHLEVTDEGGALNGAATIQLIHAGGIRAAGTGSPDEDPTKGSLGSGMIAINAMGEVTGAAVGGTVSATPSSGFGPIYQAGGVPDPDAESITDGQYFFLDMDPGEVTLTFSQPDAECERWVGASWPASDPSRLDQSTVLIVPGYISILGRSVCTPVE